MTAFLTATIRDADGAPIGVLVLKQKTFATGSQGFHGQGKLEIGGVRYQAQAQLVALKPKVTGDDATKAT